MRQKTALNKFRKHNPTMNMHKLNQVCFTICMVCIVLGVLLSLAMIWGETKDEFVWKSWLTILVFFLGSALTLSVNKTLGSVQKDKGKDNDQSGSR